jgi:hypothetical protein
MAYAFKGIFSNEMKGLVFPCTGTGAVPFGPSYNDTSVCSFEEKGGGRGKEEREKRKRKKKKKNEKMKRNN